MRSLRQTRDAIAARTLSAQDAVRGALDRIDAVDGGLHAFLEVFEREAMDQARAVDARLASLAPGEPAPPLAGVPVAIKDNICLAWGKTTCGSRMLEHYRSPYTATAAQRLIDAGAVIVGKTNLDEFAMGSSTENSAFGPSRNPWDPTRVPGGTSGGSAAAVAAGLCCAALGSDTGGSIRQPAGWCGVVGVKPTYGRVSRYGLVAHASSLDQIGPLARSVDDAAIMLSVLCGRDPHDSTSADLPGEDFTRELAAPATGLKLGVLRQSFSEANAPAVVAAMQAAVEVYRGLGAGVVEVELPMLEHAISAYYLISTAEASSNLARFDGVRYGRRAELGVADDLLALYRRSRSEGLGPEVQRRIMLGTYALSSGYYDAYYLAALKARRLIKADYDRVFASAGGSGVQAILMPASPGPAFRIGAKGDDPLAMYLEDIYTVGVNLAGLPGLTIPAGFAVETSPEASGEGGAVSLPLGMQLIGPALSEHSLLQIGGLFERATVWAGRRPPMPVRG